MKYKTLRDACCEANLRLPATGLVDLTFGNVSVLDTEEGVFAIKPSGVDYCALTPNDIVIVDLDGQIVEGNLRPSSDTPSHRRLYLGFADKGVRAIVHTHSRCAVAFAQAGRDLPCFGTTHADHFQGPVLCTRWLSAEEIAKGYEWNTATAIVERFEQESLEPLHRAAVLVRGHGPFTWGVNADKALENAFALEICCDMALKTLALNPAAQPIPEVLADKHFLRKHGKEAYYGQP